MKVASSCLLGKKCRYNGEHNLNSTLVQSLETSGEAYFDICPEVLAGLTVPRIPCEIVGGTGKEVLAGKAKVETADGQDLTDTFLKGAQDALRHCIEQGVEIAYLKARSPSCGYGEIYDGSFTRRIRKGNGIFAELLAQQGIKIIPL